MSGGRAFSRRHSRYKGPEVGLCLGVWRNTKEARVLEAGDRRRWKGLSSGPLRELWISF